MSWEIFRLRGRAGRMRPGVASVTVGQKVRAGVVAEPPQSGASYVCIFTPGHRSASAFHPSEVHP